MSDENNNSPKFFGFDATDFAINVLLVFLIWPVSKLLMLLWTLIIPGPISMDPPTWLGVGLFFGVLLAEPAKTYRQGKGLKRTLLGFAGGCLVGVAMALFLDIDERPAADVDSGGPETITAIAEEDSGQASLPSIILSQWYIILLPLIVLAYAFGGSSAERFHTSPRQTFLGRVSDAVLEFVDTLGPVLSIFTSFVGLLFYTLWDPSYLLAMAMIFATWCGVIFYVIYVWDGEHLSSGDDAVASERSTSFGAAFTKLLDVSVQLIPSAIIMGGMMWFMLDVGSGLMPEKGAFQENPISLIWFVLLMCGFALVIVPAGFLGGALLTALVLAWFTQREMWSADELEARAEKASSIMLGFAAMTMMRFPSDDQSRDRS